MILRIREWIKGNKLATILLLIIVGFILKNNLFGSGYYSSPSLLRTDSYANEGAGMSLSKISLPVSGALNGSAMPQDMAIQSGANRMVVSNSNLSLMVSDVLSTQKLVINKAKVIGGYMVDSILSNPQDAASATVTIRIPSSKLNDALDYFRGLAIKVVSENLQGEDVTDQYVDNDARLETLNTTKRKFEDILNKATTVQDIVSVQQQIINLQSQIDQIKGQQKYLEQNTNLTKVTLYLSTDELALPYAPTESWRPSVIFKEAVRSVISSVQKLGTLIIWLTVYAVIWVPVLLIIYLVKKRRNSKKMQS